ncbi:hypothetical protein R0K17_29245, partial [Planococcus sp. SIMBA_143]
VEKTTLENEHRRAESEKERLDESVRQKSDRLQSLKKVQTEEAEASKQLQEKHAKIEGELSSARAAYKEARARMEGLEAQYD